MPEIDHTYRKLLESIIDSGYTYKDPNRKGVSRQEHLCGNLIVEAEPFPAITLKKLFWKGVVGELLWFLSGGTNIKFLNDRNITIWNDDAYKHNLRQGYKGTQEQWMELCKEHDYIGVGDLGPVYGSQWRDFNGTDQIEKLVHNMRNNPMSSELIVSAWNPAEMEHMALPPCHYEFQVVARPLTWVDRVKLVDLVDVESGTIDHELMDTLGIPKYEAVLCWSQRSVDTFLGLPFNVASYTLLLHILCKMANMVPIGVVGNLKKLHLYDNSIGEARELLKLDPDRYDDVKLEMANTLNFKGSIDDFVASATMHDFTIQGYRSYPPVKVEMLSRDA